LNRLRLFSWLFKTPLKGWAASQLARPRGLGGRWAAGVMNASNAALSEWAAEKLELGPKDHVMELGFGGGAGLPSLLKRAFRVEGVDRSVDMVRMGLGRWADFIASGKLALGEGELDHLPFADANFQAVLSVNTVYFWPDAALGARELYRVLTPGGRLVLGLRAGQLTKQAGLEAYGFRIWTKEELIALLRGVGFQDVRVDEEAIYGGLSWAAFGRKPS
jgi:arsenite methyltransferase